MARAFNEMAQGMTVALRKHYDLESLKKWYAENGPKDVWYTIGTNPDDGKKLDLFLKAMPKGAIDKLCIDVANGYSRSFPGFVEAMREKLPDAIIMAGNVVTGDMTQRLLESGADIVKVGIGPGSVCTTRILTGVGRPQFSAVVECAEAAHEKGGLICADGGCTVPGDLPKAFGAGADFVMLGGMLAAHDQSEIEPVERDGKLSIPFYGMSSETAMNRHSGGMASYRASEGKEVPLDLRGDVKKEIARILGGLRSACAYTGAAKLEELPEKATFTIVRQQFNPVFGN
jgi:GMP reductase